MSEKIFSKSNLCKVLQGAAILSLPYFMNRYLSEQDNDDAKNSFELEKPQQGKLLAKTNKERLLKAENKIISMIALMENFSPEPYMSGGAATIGYGSCYKPNGQKVNMSHQSISPATARLYTAAHLRKDVFPAIEKYVKRGLDENQLIAASTFVYFVSSNGLAKSEFLRAINAGKSDFETARKISGWKTAGGEFHPGLLKRHWLSMALYCHRLKPEQLLEMSPGSIYNLQLGELYKNSHGDRDGFYTPKMDDQTLNVVLRKCKGRHYTLRNILDDKVKKDLFSQATLSAEYFSEQMMRIRRQRLA